MTVVNGTQSVIRWRVTFHLRTLLLVMCVLAIVFAVVGRNYREGHKHSECIRNLNALLFAFESYQLEHGTYPPAYIPDENGKPMHSWRILILPHLGEHETYRLYNLNEPWNGPNNRPLADRMPACFRCPASDLTSPYTNYLALIGMPMDLEVDADVWNLVS